MLRLTLVRHAKAEAAHAGQEDFDRALHAEGQREAVEMGQRLSQLGWKPTALVTSPALRASTTASLLARELGFPSRAIIAAEHLYLISVTDLFDWLREQTRSTEHLMVVAHNPGLSEFAARIAAQPTVDVLPTCAAYTLELPIEQWRDLAWGSGQNGQLETPRLRP
jgi:phosphohistidine phosphatase